MESYKQTPDSVNTKQGEEREKRTETLIVRMSPKENYLLKQVDEKLGFGNVSTSVRWLIEHFSDLEKAKKLVEAAAAREKWGNEFKRLAEE